MVPTQATAVPSVPSPRVLIVTELASFRLGGEPSMPPMFFKYFRERGVEAWLMCHERFREELFDLFPNDRDRFYFTPSSRVQDRLTSIGYKLPDSVNGLTFMVVRRALGHVLIAEEVGSTQNAEGNGIALPSTYCPLPTPLVYCIGNDQYFKRDEVGIIYQMNVLPGKQRGFIGATLLKAMFERSAYGCKRYCCWCAQDIAANKFWEAMGFVPLAFRAGSEKKSRVHIFWQKRIRQGDVTTPWWFPSKTAGGSIREDRIVLPISPGTHWSDAKPLILPDNAEESKQLPPPKRAAAKKPKILETLAPIRRNGLMFDIPKPGEPLPEMKATKEPKPKSERVKRMCDPRLVSAARELRDRWLEKVNATQAAVASGKYEVGRLVESEGSGPKMRFIGNGSRVLPAPAA